MNPLQQHRRGNAGSLIILVLALVLLGGGAWLLFGRSTAPAETTAQGQEPATPSAPAATNWRRSAAG